MFYVLLYIIQFPLIKKVNAMCYVITIDFLLTQSTSHFYNFAQILQEHQTMIKSKELNTSAIFFLNVYNI